LRALIAWLGCVATASGVANAADILNEFLPSAIQSKYGVVSEVKFSTGLVELEPGALAHHQPHAMRDFRFGEPVWMIRYKTEILDRNSRVPRENYLCHTFFGDQRVVQRQDQELRGIYSDAFTPEVRVPEGFGVRLDPEDRLHWMPMFNNRGEDPAHVEMKVTVSVIRERDLKRPVKPLYATLRSVQVPHLYFVPPGQDEKQLNFEMPFDGRIHFLGTHMHPYGLSIELFNVTRSERVWTGRRVTDSQGRMVAMETFSSEEGYTVRAGESYRVTAVYDNPTGHPMDAMAGLFLLYSRR
jgi:hypothetical protein